LGDTTGNCKPIFSTMPMGRGRSKSIKDRGIVSWATLDGFLDDGFVAHPSTAQISTVAH
jgi:hypothetical protein